jgi:uncharacterized membrane protein YphA (DoxX/SURF4 family)
MRWLILALRLGLGGLLLLAGALKVTHPEALAAAIAGFRLLPQAAIVPLAIAMPYVELLLGLYLVLGLFTRIAAYLVSIEFVVYAAAIASAVLRHIPANCGCFGPNDRATADWPHVVLDLILAAVAALVARAAPGALALDRRLARLP